MFANARQRTSIYPRRKFRDPPRTTERSIIQLTPPPVISTVRHGRSTDPGQTALIREAIASGRLHRPEEAMQEALLLWEARVAPTTRTLAAIQLSRASWRAVKAVPSPLARNPSNSQNITRRCMARLAAEQNPRG